MVIPRPLPFAFVWLLAGCGACSGADPEPAPPAGELAAACVAVTRGPDGRFPETVAYDGRPLLRQGTGLCEWGFLAIDLYEAALYVERRVDSRTVALAGDQVAVIHLHFVRSLTAAQLREAYAASAKVNAGGRLADHQPALDRLLAAMQSVDDGDGYTFVADPARGLVVQRDGRELDVIADDAFRLLFLRLYLGDHPPTTALRDGLLGVTR